MPEDRLQAVESTLAQVVAGQGRLEERQSRLEEGQGRLEGRQERLEATVAELRADTNRGFEDLGRQMRVLHEDTIDHVRAHSADIAQLKKRRR